MYSYLRWWNSEMETPDAISVPNTCPFPKILLPVWKRNFPPFLKVDSTLFTDPKRYWCEISKIIKEYLPKYNIPDPFTRFDEYVKVLYDLKKLISPISVKQVCTLIQTHNQENINNFIVYELPVIIKHPVLYMNTIYELMVNKSDIWTNMCHSPEYNQAFFGLYCSFLNKMKSDLKFSWDYKLKMTEIMRHLIAALPREDEVFETNSCMFLKNVASMIGGAPAEVQISVICAFFYVLKISKKKIGCTDLKDYFNDILDNVSPDSDAFPLLFQYSISCYTKSNYISLAKLHKVLRHRKINSVYDFSMFHQLMQIYHNPVVLSSIAKLSITNPCFLRTGFYYIFNILIETQSNASIVTWAITYVKRLVLYPLLSNVTGMFYERSLLILEFLSALQKSPVNKKIINQLNSSLAAIRDIKECPEYVFNFVNVDGMPDRTTQKEFSAMLKKKKIKNLMQYYPFIDKQFEFLKPISSEKSYVSAKTTKKDAHSYTPEVRAKKDVVKPFNKPVLAVHIPDATPDIVKGDSVDQELLDMIETSDAMEELDSKRPKTAKNKRKSSTASIKKNHTKSVHQVASVLSPPLPKKKAKESIRVPKPKLTDISSVEEARLVIGEVTESTRSASSFILMEKSAKPEMEKRKSSEDLNIFMVEAQRKAEIEAKKHLMQLDSYSTLPIRKEISIPRRRSSVASEQEGERKRTRTPK